MKRALALVLALVLCLGVLAGCKDEPAAPSTNAPTVDNNKTTTGTPTTTEYVYTTPDFGGAKITLYCPNNKDYEAEGCYANTIVEKKLNLDWYIHEIESGANVIETMLAEGKVPELQYTNAWNVANAQQAYDDGIYINYYDYVKDGKYPNIAAYLNSEDPKIQADIAKFTLPGGELTNLPITKTGDAAVYGYFYRADLFEKEKLTFATTQDEFYNLLKTLKTKYPSSYPFVLRNLTKNMQTLSDGWGVTWGQGRTHTLSGYNGTYFRALDDNKYFIPQSGDVYKEMAQYFVKLTKEGLLHPSSMTLDTAGWNESFASGTSFIGYDKMDRIPSILTACSSIEGVRFTGAAPIAMGTYGTTSVNPLGETGYSLLVGNDKKTIETVLTFLDWMYSEEGITMTNWGIEGESYTVDANGNKAWKEGWLESKGGLTATGLGIPITTAYKDFDAYLASLDEDLKNAISTVLPYQNGKYKAVTITLNEEEKTFNDTYGKAYYDYAQAELSKFMLGTRDFSEWDAFKNELLKDYKGEELLKYHQAALDRALAGK